MNAPISEVMTRNVVCVPEYFSVTTLEELLLEHHLSGAPVVDDGGKVVGFVAITDVVRELYLRDDTAEAFADDSLGWGFHQEPEPRTVAHVMVPSTFVLPVSCPVAEAVSLMTTQQVHRVPVVSDDGLLLGIVTAADIMRYLARAGRAASERAGIADGEGDVWNMAARARFAAADRVVSLGFLAGGVAYHVNNTLTPMRSSLERLVRFELSRRPPSAEQVHRIELLQDVREGVERIEQIICELKAFSHMDGPSRAIDVSELIEVAIGLAAHEIRHRARLVCDYAAVPLVRAKPAELRQVFLNLLINAVQAMPEGEAHMNEIRVMTRTDDHGCAVIEIQDTGTGIPPDVAARIFEPFFTARSEGKGLGLGLGLGLTVSRDIVLALDGEITIDSVVGKGTTVRVVLPPYDGEEVLSEVPNESRPDHAVTSERRRILVIDDGRPVAAALALELEAHDVVVAENGREALEILQRDKGFDMILCDLMMLELSGIDAYEALRLIDPTLLDGMVLMTGGAFTARARQFRASARAGRFPEPVAGG
jgi:signal transduction histidine kinase/CheY-like chemotaxis protein